MPKKHGSPAKSLTKSDLIGVIGTLEKRVDSKIDSLALAVSTGFTETHQMIAELKGDVKRIDSRLYRQQEMIDGVKQAVGSHSGRIKVLEAGARARS